MIGNLNYDVVSGVPVEMLPGAGYSYSDSMKILLISHPCWFKGNERPTRKNPDVVSEDGVVGLMAIG
jgi:hypothetical protein